MPRQPRVQYPGAIFHVIARGNNKQQIFHDERDYLKYLFIFQDALSMFPFYVLTYALMPNHIHLLIEVKGVSLGQLIKYIHQRYAQYFNLKNDRCGHVFQGPYKSFLVDVDNYFTTLIQYVTLNPLRAGIVTDLSNYRWAGHYELTSGKNYIISKDRLLGYLADTQDKGIERYHSLISQGSLDELPTGSYLNIENDEKPMTLPATLPSLPMNTGDLLDMVCRVFHADKRLVVSRTKQRDIVLARKVFIFLAKHYLRIPSNEVTSIVDISSKHVSKVYQELLFTEDSLFLNAISKVLEEVDKWRNCEV